MALNPPAVSGKQRVVRIHQKVTEAYVDAALTPAQAVAAAKALGTNDWTSRKVLQVSGEDGFEYNVVSSDGV